MARMRTSCWLPGFGASAGKSRPSPPRDDLKPRFSLLASDVTNAMALPGGQVFVTRGLLDSVTSDDELAGVMAHEVGHVARRHALKHIGENGVAIALLSLVGRRDIRMLGLVMNILRGLARSRELESQADEVGLGLAAAAGYDPRGLVRFLESINGGKTSKLEAYFLTHPLPEKRIEACRRSPLVARVTLEDREAQAASFERRGLYTSAAAVRAGQNPLALPGITGPPLSALFARDREGIGQQSAAALKQLGGAWKVQRFGESCSSSYCSTAMRGICAG
ncbi:MAG: M48 family metalloprotease [Armatimonas sp.]